MSWQVRHEGSPKSMSGLTLAQIVQGLRDGRLSLTDEVMGPQDNQWLAIENHPQFAEVAEELEELPTRPHEDETRLDMNALIDVTLVLLIFFILTTTRSVAVQKIVPLPTILDAKKGTKVYQSEQVKKYMIQMKVSPEGGSVPVIRLEGKSVDVLHSDKKTLNKEELSKLIKPHLSGQPPKTEMVLEAHNVSWGLVVAIQDAAKSAGVRIIHHLHRKEKVDSSQ